MKALLVQLILSAGIGAFFVIVCAIAYSISRALNITQHRRKWENWTVAALSLAAALPLASCQQTKSIQGNGAGGALRVTASRLFAGPNQYPPEDFAAYGILAFRSRASPHDRAHHVMICNAYATSLPHTSELEVPPAEQMVTVWPVDSGFIAIQLNRTPRNGVCEIGVDNYGLVIAQQALKDAELAGVDTTASGPFLLSWSPSADKGKRDTLVLVSDLSDVTTYEQAREIFLKWSRDIERDPQLWSNGWDVERLRTKIRHWVDKFGPKALAVFGTKG